MAKNNNEYKTSDLYEASAIYAKHEKLVGIETTKKPYVFIFANYDVCNVISLEYINNELAVLAKDYADAIKLLKSRVNTM